MSLLDIAATEIEASALKNLRGVQQVALNAFHLSFETITAVARIPGLESLVLSSTSLSNQQLQELGGLVPEVILVTDEA